jgi:hypothetical protein
MKTPMNCALLALLSASVAHADEEKLFKVSGMAVLGATYSSERNADYTSGIDHPNGAGKTRTYDFLSDSRLIVQVDSQFNEQFSAMLQVTSEHRYNNTFVPHVTASALNWQVTPNIDLRIGRQPFVSFLVPDETVAWTRQTTEVYQSGLLNLYDGARLTAKTQWGDTTLTAQGYVGSIQYPIPGDVSIRFTNLVGVNLFGQVGNSTVRFSSIRGRFTLHSPITDQAFALLRTLPNGNALANRYQVQDTPSGYNSLSYAYQNSTGYLLAEVMQFSTGDSFVADSTQGEITAGYHIGKFTPFATLAGKQANKVASDPNPIVNALFAGRNVGQKSAVVGVRWNWMKNTVLKAQCDYVINSTGSAGALSNVQAGFQPGGRYRLISAALEYTF